MLTCIKGNPFFLLGIYANAKIKERTAHVSKIKAYANVGKSVAFPLDFPNITETPERTEATVESALSIINTPKDCFIHSLFWLSEGTKAVAVALEHALSGNLDKAIEILNKQRNAISRINLSVLYYLTDKPDLALEAIFSFIHDEGMFKAYISLFREYSGHQIDITPSEVSELYLEHILQDFPAGNLIEKLKNLNMDLSVELSFLNLKFVGPYCTEIDKVLSKANSSDNENLSYSELSEKASKVVLDTSIPRQKLLDIVGKDSSVAEDVMSKVSQCVHDCALAMLRLKENEELYQGKSKDISKIKEFLLNDNSGLNAKVFSDITSFLRKASEISLSDIFKSNIENELEAVKTKDKVVFVNRKYLLFSVLCDNYGHSTSSNLSSAISSVSSFVNFAIPIIKSIHSYASDAYVVMNQISDVIIIIPLNILFSSMEAFVQQSTHYNTSFSTRDFDALVDALAIVKFLISEVNSGTLTPSENIVDRLSQDIHQFQNIVDMASGGRYYELNWRYSSKDYFIVLKSEKNSTSNVNRGSSSHSSSSSTNSTSTSSSNQQSSGSNGHCYIATLVYGDYDHPKVKVLRNFRDNVLLTNYPGKQFVKFYYRYSPRLVAYLRNKKLINGFIRFILNGFVYVYKKIKNI